MKRTRGVLTSLAACAVLLSAQGRAATPDRSAQGPAAVGATAPGFSRTDLGGKTVELSALHGHVVLLNFWATWCSPCLSEVPRFAQWQKTYRAQGLQVVGVSMDDDEAPVREAYAKFKLNYAVVMGDAKLGETYGGVYGLPLTLLIDREGTIRFRHSGASDLDRMQTEIRDLLLNVDTP